MKKITRVIGGIFHLGGNDMDTDRIVPARNLKCVTFEGLGNSVFEDDRRQLKGAHPFDNPINKGCTVLLVDANFGSGSSREHAVPAIMQWGIRAIIGLSFADIFRGNAVGNGLVCVTVTPEDHEVLQKKMAANPYLQVNIDLEKKKIVLWHTAYIGEVNCELPDADREKLLKGKWDDMTTLLEAGDAIEKTAARLPYFQNFAAA